MNSYEEKQQARKARYEELAEKARAESHDYYGTAREMGEAIPFGQPVMGERDRRYRGRISDAIEHSIKAEEKARYYEGKAAAVGKGGISSLDPDAISKLEKQLSELEATQERMKMANKAIRLKNVEAGNQELKDMGYSESEIKALRTPDFCGRVGYPNYLLSNNNGNMRRIRGRIEELKKVQSLHPEKESTSLYTFCVDDGRVQFSFNGKPVAVVRDVLKSHGFRWSPSRRSWVRQATAAGLSAAESVKNDLKEYL